MAFPFIGAGSGGFDEARALSLMREELETVAPHSDVRLVRYGRS